MKKVVAKLKEGGVGGLLKAVVFKLKFSLFPPALAPRLLVRHRKLYQKYLRNKQGLEIGGPSALFEGTSLIPIYPLVKHLDGCNFSSSTVWEGNIQQGLHYRYDGGQRLGYQYICEASDLTGAPSNHYDFVLSCHSIEHIANPLKALREWMRVLKSKGALLMVIPHKDFTFDHRRPVTQLTHLIEDDNQQTTEEDLTHLPEILALHDLSMDPWAGGYENFEKRSLKNYENRCLHHHVFDACLVAQMLDHLNVQIDSLEVADSVHIIVIGHKVSGKADNRRWLGKYAAERS